jgi:Uma2 family endonuclease
MVASGGFDEDARIELIEGYVVDMSPRTPQHENAISWLLDWLIDQLDRSRFQVRVAAPLTIGGSEPEPDLAVIERAPAKPAHPSRALLVIEVAVSSRDRDLRLKPRVYAPAVDEYWVVDLERRCVVVHRGAAAHGYQDVELVPEDGLIAAGALDLTLPVAELFANALAS